MDINSALKLIKIVGSNAKKFLQGQLTCDLEQVSSDRLLLGAYLNVKGRIESLFEIFQLDHDYYLLLPASIAEHTATLLKKYAVLSKVSLEIINVTEVNLPATLPKNFNDWRIQRIENGLPTLFPETIGKFLPHDLNLPELGAVSFTKGCYLGQEIVARMQHLGKPKWHMIKGRANGSPGDVLEDGSIIVDTIQNDALENNSLVIHR